MFIWSIKWILISLVIIILSENILTFLKRNYSVPETKDYINIPNKMYDNIYNIINENDNNTDNNIKINNSITNADKNNMKEELKRYINEDLEKEQIIMKSENSSYYSEYI